MLFIILFVPFANLRSHSGIPDFRGPTGVWTLRAQGKEPSRSVSSLKAMPTITHMSLVQLQNTGKVARTTLPMCSEIYITKMLILRKLFSN